MCVAIGQRKGADTLTETQLENGWDSNPHGGGYSFIEEDGTIAVHKFMEKDAFIDAYRLDHKLHGVRSPFIVHMRIATHGEVKLETVHPFPVVRETGELVFAHNGIISELEIYTDKDRSDTMAFGDLFLEFMPAGFLDNSAIYDLLESYISYDKLVLLTTEPEHVENLYIIGEMQGEWIGETWFSNKSCEVSPRKTYYKSSVYGGGGAPYGTYEYYDDEKDLDAWLARDIGTLEEDELKSNIYPMKGEDPGSKDPAMSLVVRANMNSLIIKETWDKLVEEAERVGYCGLCLFSPCMCDDTCYYCNCRMASCDCECWVSIEDMGSWVGYKEIAQIRREDLIGEARKEGMF